MYCLNESPFHHQTLDPSDKESLSMAASSAVRAWLDRRGLAAPTPLLHLNGLAASLGLGAISVKDEGQRLGLQSFKALGGAYAVAVLIAEEASRRLGRAVATGDLSDPEVRAIAAAMTFACATDGNHGRSVAQGAQAVGAKAVIFMHERVSVAREAAIARFGARVVRVAGTYDDSVAEAARVAEREGWTIVSDTSWPGYDRIPMLVMQGYTLIMREALEALEHKPTHVFIQSGVGGIAAACAASLSDALGEQAPFFVVVDPDRAACLLASAKAGHPVKLDHGEETVMSMLECYEPSLVAFRVLQRTADAFLAASDARAIEAMNHLAKPVAGDPAVVAGESGAAGLAGLLTACGDPAIRKAFHLDAKSRILLVITEGATDPSLYEKFTGLAPEDVVGK